MLDRAGVTGPDGASHNGMWDLAMLGIVPDMRVAAPRDATRLREELAEALAVGDGPTALRFPKGDVGEDIPALHRAAGGLDVLATPADGLGNDVLLVAVGALAGMALGSAERLRNRGSGVTVVDPRWVLPVSDGLVELAAAHKLVVTLEGQRRGRRDRVGGVGGAAACRDRCALSRHRRTAAVPGARLARRDLRRDRAHRPECGGGSRMGCRAGAAAAEPRSANASTDGRIGSTASGGP